MGDLLEPHEVNPPPVLPFSGFPPLPVQLTQRALHTDRHTATHTHTQTHTHTDTHTQPLGIDRNGSPQQLEHTPSAMCHATAVGVLLEKWSALLS